MSSEIRDLQMALLEILKTVDAICKKHNIQYSLASGTALGAVRHSGFIPWDDDLDIMFLRSEYDRFLEVAVEELKDTDYVLQREFSEKWPMSYSKIRKNNTAYIEGYKPKIPDIHQGIFIDLFPVDNLLDNRIKTSIQWMCYQLVLANCLNKRGYTTESKTKRIAMLLSSFVPVKPFVKYVQARSNNNSLKVHSYFGGAVIRTHNEYPKALFLEYNEIKFEDDFFQIVKDYDSYLKIAFGDYMELPPEDKRGEQLHAIKVDLENSYEQYRIGEIEND